MTDNSLLKGSIWYWRRGIRQLPIHGHIEEEDYKTKELYTPVVDDAQMQNLMKELRENGVNISSKTTHSPYDAVPKGSLIVYAALSQGAENEYEKKNIEKLRTYILANGGRIDEKKQVPQIVKGFFFGLFGRGRK